MHRTHVPLLVAALLALVAVGCAGDRVEDTEGSVILSVTDFDGLPLRVGVNSLLNDDAPLILGQVTVSNIPKDQNANTSSLQDVEMTTYEIVYERVDTGTRVPPPLVRRIFGVAPVGGTVTYDNLVIMGAEQLENPPLSDLDIFQGGIDSETGSQVIKIGFRMRFFGRTIAGDQVATAPARFDIEFVP